MVDCTENPQPFAADVPVMAVGGVIYRWRRKHIELLLIKKDLGYWTLVKGQLKSGESDAHAVAREVREETALRGTVGHAVETVHYTIYKDGQPREKVVSYYLFLAKKGTIRLSKKERIIKARWFKVPEALNRIRRRRIRDIARHAAEIIQARQ